MSNELYIGMPNGIVLCVDEGLEHDTFRGRMYHKYSKEAIPVSSFWELVREMENLFNEIQFPRPGTRDRSFTKDPPPRGGHQQSKGTVPRAPGNIRKEREIVMSDKDLLKLHGDYGTFIIRVQQRQGGTWQGRITWADRNKTVHFRSVLEMIKLIEDGILADHPELLEEEKTPHWDE